MCVCVFMYVCVYVCMSIYICIHTCACIYIKVDEMDRVAYLHSLRRIDDIVSSHAPPTDILSNDDTSSSYGDDSQSVHPWRSPGYGRGGEGGERGDGGEEGERKGAKARGNKVVVEGGRGVQASVASHGCVTRMRDSDA